MSNPIDSRIRAFVVELLDDPPTVPPFPHPDMVVIKGDRSTRREHMTDTRIRPSTATLRRSRGPLLGAAVFAVIVVIALGGIILTNVLDDDPQLVVGSQDFGELEGTNWEFETVATDTQGGTLRFATGMRFTVTRPDGEIVDAGTYRTEGDLMIFVTDEPYGCAGVEGSYRWTFSEPGRGRFNVVFDECTGRIGDATASEIIQIAD